MVRLANIKNIENAWEGIKSHVAEYFLIGTNQKGDGKYPLGRLKMDIIGEETLTADCDVTDHYVESNTAFQDQISLKPKIFTIQGEVGELVWYQKDQDEQGLGQVAQRLEGVISFLPIRSKSFNQMKAKAMKALQWVDTASNALSKLNTLTDGLSEGKQQSAFVHLCQYRDERQILTIKTPWGFLSGYVITNLKFTQPRDTKDKTYISITFKEFRATSVSTVPFDSAKYQANAAFENQPKVNNGKTSGVQESIAEDKPKENPVTKQKEPVCPLEDDRVNVFWDEQQKRFMVVDMDTKEEISPDSQFYDNSVFLAVKRCGEKIGVTYIPNGSNK